MGKRNVNLITSFNFNFIFMTLIIVTNYQTSDIKSWKLP